MNYNSTRDNSRKVSGAEAIARGIAPDGGLYVPETLPKLSLGEIEKLAGHSYPDLAFVITKLFLPEFTDEEVYEYTKSAYGANFDDKRVAPLVCVDGDKLYSLELWHGPTSAFKDMALQYMPKLLTASLEKSGETRTVCILVATSGDTGKAALEGYRDVDGTRIIVFYPKNGVSDVQALQMVTQEGANVSVCAIEGNFDDAQNGVKELFADNFLRDELERKGVILSSANSINWGRLLPQIVYYFYAYLQLFDAESAGFGSEIDFAVPTGNFGNILAGYIAREMGLPIRKLICASNANKVLADFFATGTYDKRRELVLTNSPSMDILISSNLERLLYLASGRDDTLIKGYMSQLSKSGKYTIDENLRAKLATVFSSGYADDAASAETIRAVWERWKYLADPHTAVALNVASSSGELEVPTVVISTASPYKFASAVLAALGDESISDGLGKLSRLSELTGVSIPKPLAELAGKQLRFDDSVSADKMREYVLSVNS
ncbi:MAG: threonine synthase [Oscillospiraceae bacterium]|jgi:threonine synthase|nr:threonine synthase [Oscillospiraceae bacterium]